jgi:hypothetical protein
MFAVTSRYFTIETAVWMAADGRQFPYLRRRFLPTTLVPQLAEHVVTQNERLDMITATYLGDPEQFWRVADANNAMQPNELTRDPGQRLRIPIVQGG